MLHSFEEEGAPDLVEHDQDFPHARRGGVDLEDRAALALQPALAGAQKGLRAAVANQQAALQVLARQREAVRERPDDAARLNNLAWTLSTHPDASLRNGAEAVELGRRAVRISDGREPSILGTLAAAYAEAGRYADAVRTAEAAWKLALQQDRRPLATSIEAKRALYKAGRPFRDAPNPAQH